MKSTTELELELANAKLAKMTSTVKQLGTKLKAANETLHDREMELGYYKHQTKILREQEDLIRKIVLTKEEAHSQAIAESYRYKF